MIEWMSGFSWCRFQKGIYFDIIVFKSLITKHNHFAYHFQYIFCHYCIKCTAIPNLSLFIIDNVSFWRLRLYKYLSKFKQPTFIFIFPMLELFTQVKTDLLNLLIFDIWISYMDDGNGLPISKNRSVNRRSYYSIILI